MSWSRRSGLAAAVGAFLAALAVVPAAAAAELARAINVQVTVAQVSDDPGEIDPSGAEIYRHLLKDFRYRSVKVLETREFQLRLDQSGSLRLPTGRWLTVRPRKLGDDGVLLAVEVEGRIRTSLRVPSHHEVVIGAEPYQGGKLVVSLEPRY